jgi:ferric iron reductase protein FhuF
MNIIILIFLGLIPILLLAFLNFDKLVKIEYEKFKTNWIDDGKPRGFFWKPTESNWFSSSFAMQQLAMYWLFKTPDWINNELKAKEALQKLRIYVLIWNIGMVMWVLLSLNIKKII